MVRSYIPFEDVTKATGIVNAYHDHWWIVDPNQGLLMIKLGRDSVTQCNRDEKVAEYLRNRLYPDLEIRQFPLVLVTVDPRDYQ